MLLTTTLRRATRLIVCRPASLACFVNDVHKRNLIVDPRAGYFGDKSEFQPDVKRKNFKDSILPLGWYKLVDRYPEFLPDPINNSPLLVYRQIDDMLERREVIEIPDFYVGSVLAVTTSDQFSETKKTRFVGICIHRTGQLKYANFTLRNVIDGMGCEVRYDLYNPLILSIEVLRFEKRLDDNLMYLRDALPEYSTFPEDMKPEAFDPNEDAPLNPLRVKMKPFPWTRKWHNWFFKGVEKLENVPQWFAEKARHEYDSPVHSYDLMAEYRTHVTEEMIYNICKRLAEHDRNVVEIRNEARTKRFLRVAKKD